MRRALFVWAAVAMIAVTSWAQQRPGGGGGGGGRGQGAPGRPPQGMPGRGAAPQQVARPEPVVPIIGDRKLKYLAQQLELTPEQAKHVDGLLDEYKLQVDEHNKQMQSNVALLPDLAKKMTELDNAGDKEGAQRIREELMRMTSTAHLEEQFLKDLTAILNDTQKAALAAAQQRLERNPSGEVMPIEVLRMAQAGELTDAQRVRMRNTMRVLRAQMGAFITLQPAQKDSVIQKLLEDLSQFLPPEKMQTIRARVATMTPEPAASPSTAAENGHGETPAQSGAPAQPGSGG